VNRSIQTKIAGAIGLPAAIVLIASIGGMTARYVAFRRHAPEDAARVAALESQAKQDPARAAALKTERDRQTEATLQRKARTRKEIPVLIVSAVLFLVGGKWLHALRADSAPSLTRIQACKDDSAPARRWRLLRRAKTDGNGEIAAPEIDLTFVDKVVQEHGRGTEAAIPILQQIQKQYRYLPDEALRRVCELTEISPAQIAGVSTFYAQFRRSPVGKHIIKVCHGTACHVSGATEITEELRRRLKIATDSDTDPERMFTLDEVACLGCCSLAPVIMIDETTAGKLTPAAACEAVRAFRLEHSA
jgi:NADH:ubiquinone oxidoreductase subunit E